MYPSKGASSSVTVQEPLSVDDGGGSLTVDGAVSATVSGEVEIKNDSGNPVPVSGTVTITDGSGPLTVDGTVAVSSVGGTVAVSGPLTDTQLRATPVPVSGTVTSVGSADSTTTGSITGNGQAVTLTLPASSSDINIQMTGTFVGTVVFESSVDGGTTWNPRVYRGAGILNVLETGTSTFPSEWRGNGASMDQVRVRCTSYTSGTLSVFVRASRGVGAVFLNAAIPIGGVSVGNSITSQSVAVSGTWTGTYERMTNVAAINVSVISDRDGTLNVSYSRDGTTADTTISFPVVAGTTLNRIMPPRSEYFRVSFTNGAIGTANLTVESLYRAVAAQVPMAGMTDLVPVNGLAAINKSIIEPVNTWLPVTRNVTTTAARVDQGNTGRRSVLVRARNYSANGDAIYVGSSNAVSSSNGIELKERESITLDVAVGAQVWAVGTRAAGNTLEVVELWDA